jgi:hypothetical protein
MTMLKRPGASLLLVGLVLLFLVRPIVGKIWLIGGILSPVSFIVGLGAMIGGAYLLYRSMFGSSR